MLVSLMDSKNITINTDKPVISDVTKLEINGSYLEIEGFAYFKGVTSYKEDRIRKTLLLVPNIDIEKMVEAEPDKYTELSEQEILEQHIIKLSLDNCSLSELDGDVEVSNSDLAMLGGYKGNIDLSVISHGKPLQSGEYDTFIKLEQMFQDNDKVKFEKLISLSNVREFMRNDILNTKLNYFSASKVMKYNLLVTFNKYSKTLQFKNTLLQEFDPRDMPDTVETKENKYIKKFKRVFFRMMYKLFCILPIQKSKVTFASDSRSELNGNFFFVYEELYKRNLDLDIKFVFNERINSKKTITDLIKIAYQFATSKIILLDDFYPLVYPLKIRKDADLIQVWHAAGAFKTFGYSRMGRPGGPSPRSKNHKNYTKVAVSSEGVRENYAEGFGVSVDKVYPTGVPRSDIFFDEEYKAKVRDTLYTKYSFLKGKKVILFAPTFRGNGQASAHYPFEVLNLKKLYEEFHEEYVFLFKIHPFVNNKLTIPYEYADFFYDLSDYREINDLLLITDILITDYSSVCFEFALLNKPMLFFAFDVEEYIEARDFYYNFFDFIPGPLLKSTDDIITSIKNEDYQLEKVKPFVKYFFGDTLGTASKNVVDDLIISSLETHHMESKETRLTPPKSRIELFERTMKDDENL
ncbi:CDP-glycerol glycerophosphotransferase family protein [Paucisalibacillus globulus]|uniref:CDP-glycerol glycerophosphotransferase family protein n=1 Tax=Paucisalibacillus globulus TaxID=351095 RepID=UPI000BB8ED75|nr:CDP-glycerol glycerophosphotransferase family protein [Paucisalibacillus globulus]